MFRYLDVVELGFIVQSMSNLFEKSIRPVLFRLPPETAHDIAVKLLRSTVGSAAASKAAKQFGEWPMGPLKRFGLKFTNPLGMAAGFDKNGVLVDQLAALGFGSVEIGTVTAKPQSGNPKPRLFRLPQDQALINRLGFNNDGAERVAARLAHLKRNCIVGVNIGRNKDVSNDDAVGNYLEAFDLLHSSADYVAINVSSPNTPELRALQKADSLARLLGALQQRNEELGSKPILLKVAPDLTVDEIGAIVDVAMDLKIDGIIAANTTTTRDGLITPNAERFGSGGLSGKPLARRSTCVLAQIYKLSKGKLPIVGVGGIFSGEDAFEKVAAGASLLQAYTGFIYEGPYFANLVNSELAELLRKRGFRDLDEAVGSATG
jgi:dihydroorotate dehydrogenase